MISGESRVGRRIVGRLERGDDVVGALLEACRKHGVRCGELRALGSFESVEVAEYDQVRKVWKPGRTFAGGGLEVLNLTGNVSERDGALALHAHVTLMRDRDNGVEMLGGHLNAARVFALEFVIETFDDLLLRRAPEDKTGLVLWREAIPLVAATPTPTPTPAPTPVEPEPEIRAPILPGREPVRPSSAIPSNTAATWTQVAEASARRGSAAEPEPEVAAEDQQPEAGDLIVHPAFGRCDVQRLEGDEFVHIRLRNGRLVRLSLDVVRLTYAGRDGTRKIFNARVDG